MMALPAPPIAAVQGAAAAEVYAVGEGSHTTPNVMNDMCRMVCKILDKVVDKVPNCNIPCDMYEPMQHPFTCNTQILESHPHQLNAVKEEQPMSGCGKIGHDAALAGKQACACVHVVHEWVGEAKGENLLITSPNLFVV